MSALYGPDDVSKPNGETLPGPTLSVNIQEPDHIVILVGWTKMVNATGYRIYRTPEAGMLPSDVVLLAEVGNVNSYLDDGSAVKDVSTRPLPDGSIGPWMPISSLSTPRMQLAVVNMPYTEQSEETIFGPFAGDGNDREKEKVDGGMDNTVHGPVGAVTPSHFLYAMGGKDSNGDALDTYEFLRIKIIRPTTVLESERQIVDGSWTVGDSKLLSPHSGMRAILANEFQNLAIPTGQYFVYLGGSQETTKMMAAASNSTGHLYFKKSSTFTNSHFGYCFAIANDFAFFATGSKGSPSSDLEVPYTR